MSSLKVEMVAADRKVWEGEAKLVRARTTLGDIGILPGHAPLLGVLGQGAVMIEGLDGARHEAVVDGGFLSVDSDVVTIVAENVEASSLTGPAKS
ncbi:MAG: F0F1 ATP synthase subunit epsilon [Dermatophilaceae bacterium]